MIHTQHLNLSVKKLDIFLKSGTLREIEIVIQISLLNRVLIIFADQSRIKNIIFKHIYK